MAAMLRDNKALKMQQEALNQAKAAQDEQRRLLDEERAKVQAVEDGQQRARRGRRGLLAFSDEPMGA